MFSNIHKLLNFKKLKIGLFRTTLEENFCRSVKTVQYRLLKDSRLILQQVAHSQAESLAYYNPE